MLYIEKVIVKKEDNIILGIDRSMGINLGSEPEQVTRKIENTGLNLKEFGEIEIWRRLNFAILKDFKNIAKKYASKLFNCLVENV